MSHRSSFIRRAVANEMNETIDRTVALHVSETALDLERVVNGIWGDPIAAWDEYKGKVDKQVYSHQEMSTTKAVAVLIPLRDKYASGLSRHGYRRGSPFEKPSMGRDFMTFRKWYKSTVLDEPVVEGEGCSRAVWLYINVPRAIPSKSFYHNSYNSLYASTADGLLLRPEYVGEEYFNTLVSQFSKVYDMIVGLEYLREFAEAASEHCTTPGIIKRVWPEYINFTDTYTAERIRSANMSAWPVDIRRRLKDWTNNDDHIRAADMHRTLKTVADAILKAKLMPEAKEHWQGKDFQLRDINLGDVMYEDFPQ